MKNEEIERWRRLISEKEQKKMEHCIGYDPKKTYTRSKQRFFKPYRNYYDAGTSDADWEALKEKGLADKRNETYWVTLGGLSILSVIEGVYIYSENASGNKVDAQADVIEVLLADAVFCGYGCWIPSGAKNIASRARLPHKLTMDTLHFLAEKGYVKKTYEGGCDDEGFPHCNHGWTLTKKWIEENRERYDAAQKEEYARIDAMIERENDIPFL